ncbi:hypothetical protein [Microlunatus parietis]|uniref:Uncharacterized protein n=1 Tax=Microlunatus parietis TaxID=682979 RepID=A0A7Y9I8F0_9ACTN|nr:hypothetical protein [Microlunatus parietis]NYE72251.1 hypothetical protein [Microlunatus parietis]
MSTPDHGPQQPGDWRLHDHRPEGPVPQQAGPAPEPASWSQPAPEQAVPGRRPLTARGRSWLMLVTVGCLVLMYLLIWIWYADTHMHDRFVQLPPGQPSATTVNKAQYRVHRLFVTERFDNPDYPEQPYLADAGTVFVAAEIEILRVEEGEHFYCQAKLAVQGNRQLEPRSSVYIDHLKDSKAPVNCQSDDIKVGVPYRFVEIYTVPKQFADEIFGIAVQYTDYGAPYQVVQPPLPR